MPTIPRWLRLPGVRNEATVGPQNPRTGLGGRFDKSVGFRFGQPPNLSKWQLDNIYKGDWVARRVIDAPIEDMLIRWREFDGKHEGVEAMIEAESRFDVQSALSRAMRAASLYGSAFVVPNLRDQPSSAPMPEDMPPDSLVNLLVFTRHDLDVAAPLVVDDDPRNETFGRPLIYRFRTSQTGPPYEVHHTKAIAFAGMQSIDRLVVKQVSDLGESVLTNIIDVIEMFVAATRSAAHLTQVGSQLILYMAGLNQSLDGNSFSTQASFEERIRRTQEAESVYNVRYFDAEDRAERLGVEFRGLSETLTQFKSNIAAAAGMPETRFWGRAPSGLNATGEYDARDYAETVAAKQKRLLTDPLRRIDALLAASAGIAEVPDYEFGSLLDVSEIDQSTALGTTASALTSLVNASIISEVEARAALDGTPIIGNLSDDDEVGALDELHTEEPEPDVQPGSFPPTQQRGAP